VDGLVLVVFFLRFLSVFNDEKIERLFSVSDSKE
jgi:hypothetical protein